MSALNFPNSPILNQIYNANGKSWRYDGTSWKTFYVLGVPSGGTGNTSYINGDILVGAGTSMFALPVGPNNYVLTSDNTAPFLISWKPTSAIGITNLNGISTGLQYLVAGFTGSTFNISSSGSTHTVNIPIAGSGSTGLVSTLAQTFAGAKTFSNDLIISSNTVSTSVSSGALTVSGGVGIGGSLFLTSSLPSSLSGVIVNNGVITSGSWSGSTITTFYGGTGLTSISTVDAFLSSNSAGTALTYRNFLAGSGVSFSIDASSVTFTASGTLSGVGTSAYVPLWTAGGTALTNSIISQNGTIINVAGNFKSQTKSFLIPHPLDPENKLLEHGSLEGPEHGAYLRGTGKGINQVEIIYPDYWPVLVENNESIHITSKCKFSLYVHSQSQNGFIVKRCGGNIFSKSYIEFDYLIIGDRKDFKINLVQNKW